uniref:WSD domain-containing protein n=1 Tax=Caenorhabditis tropicalis TaxID=1561998 RepID=A0A1I7UIB3_9PELO
MVPETVKDNGWMAEWMCSCVDPSDSEFLSKLSKIDPKAAEAYSWLLEKAPEHPDHSENIESTLMVVRTKVLTVFSPGKFFDSHPVCAAFKRLKDLVKKLGGPQEKEEEEGEKERILNDLKSKKFEASYRYLRRFQKLSNVISVKARCLVLNGEVNGLTQEVIQKRKNDVEEVEKAREEVQRVMGMMKVAKTINEKRKARNQLPKTAEMARNVEEKYKKRSNKMEVRREVPSEDVEKGPVPPSIRIPRIEAPNVRKVTSEDQRNTLKVIRVKKATKEDVKTSKDALIEKLRVLDPEVAEVYSRSSDDVTYLQLVLLGLRTDDPKKSAGKQKEMIEELETLILGFAKIKFVFECIFNSSGDMFPVDQVDEAIEVIKDCGRAVQKVRHLVNGTPKPQEPPSDEETLKKLSPKASEDFKSLLEFQKAHQKTLLMAKYLIAFSLNDPNTKIPKNSIEKAHKTIKTLSAVLEPLDSLLTLVRLSPGQGSEALEEMKKKREIIEEIKRKIEGGRGDLEAFGEVDLNEKQYLDLTKEPEMELSPEDKEMVENLSKFNEEAGEKLMKIFRSLNILKEFVVMGKQFIAHSYSNGIPEGRAADFVLKRCLNIVSPFSVLFDHLDDKLDGIRSRKNPKDQVENIDIIQKAMIPLGNEESTNLGTIQLIEAIFERDGIKGDTLQYPDEEEITMKFPEYNNEDTIRKKKNLVKKYKDYTQDPEFQIDAEDALIAARFSKSHPKAAEVFSRLCIDMKVFKAYDPKMRVYISISMRDTSSDPQQLADAIESLEANQEFLNRVEEALNGVRRSSVDPEAILHIDDAIHQAAKTMYSNMKKVEGVVAGKEEEEEPTMDNLQKAFPGFQFEQKKEYNDYREDPDFQLDPLDQNLVEKLYGIGEEKAARELQGAAQQLKVRTSFASKVGKYIKLCLEDTVCQKDQEFGERLYRTFDSIPKLRAENDYGDGVLGQIRRDLTHESLYSETKFREFYNEHYREAFRKGWFQPEYRGQMDEEEEQRDQAYYQLVKTMDTAFASIGKKLEELEDVELKDLEAAFPDVVHEDNDDFMKIIDNMNTERSAKWKFNVQRWAIFSGVLFAFFIFLYFYLIIVIFVSDVFKWFTGR